jgi:hypothetical protein
VRYRRGDVIFVDWTSASFADIDNVGIVTGMKGGEPLITQHTPNQRGVSCTTGRRTAEARRRSTRTARLDRRAEPGLKVCARGQGRGPAEHGAAHGRSML